MKQQIENIIKENLPEKNWRDKWNCHQVGCAWNRNRVYGNKVCDMNCENVLDNISQINTSLIADEVLKVVIMEIEKEDNKWNGNREHYTNVREALNNLLSTLSPNKENEIEEIPLFKGTMDKLNKLSVIKENKNNSRNY